MATFCLIHSSVQGPDCWEHVTRSLRADGHRTITPDLGQVGSDALAITYAREAAGAITAAMASDETDLWVLAHSASGMFLPWIPGEIADLPLRGIIYLAAYAPLAGQSLLETFRSDPAMFDPRWVGADPLDDDVAKTLLFHDCADADLPSALATRRLMIASAAMSEIYPERVAPVRSEYILCTQDRTLTPDWMQRAARERLGVTAIGIDSGHCPQSSRPAALAGILSALADDR